MSYTNRIDEGEIQIFVNGTLFSKSTILKALYWYGDKFHTSITLFDDGYFYVLLKSLQSSTLKVDELELYLQKFERDLIDFSLRETINSETKNIRELLLAKAFSNGEFDELPPGSVSDPVGFIPIVQG